MKLSIFYRKKTGEKHSIEKVYDTLLPYLSDYFSVSIIELPFLSKGFFKRIFNILFATFNQSQINHISGDIHYINVFMQKQKTVLTIHDVYPLYRTKRLKRLLLKLIWFDLPIKKSKKIITVSEFSKSQILQNFAIPPEKIEVIYNCVSPIYSFSKLNFNSSCPTILHIGTKENKNFNGLIDAIKGLNIRLIIVGKLTSLQNQKLNTFKISFDNYHNVSDYQLAELYEKCDIVSFISTYEGFGLPIIEAHAVGRPVITSNIASMPEVAGEGAIFVDPYSVEEITSGIVEIINNPDLRASLIKKGLENIKRFEPKKIAEQYIRLYKEVLDER